MRRTIDVPRIRFFRVKKQPIDINRTFVRVFLHKNEEKTTTYQKILYLCRRNIGSAPIRTFQHKTTTKTCKQRNDKPKRQIKTTQQKQRNNNNQNENHKSNYQL